MTRTHVATNQFHIKEPVFIFTLSFTFQPLKFKDSNNFGAQTEFLKLLNLPYLASIVSVVTRRKKILPILICRMKLIQLEAFVFAKHKSNINNVGVNINPGVSALPCQSVIKSNLQRFEFVNNFNQPMNIRL